MQNESKSIPIGCWSRLLFFLPFANIETISLHNCISSQNLAGGGGGVSLPIVLSSV